MLPTQCLCTKLRRAARNVTKRYDDALEGAGLKAAQYSLLRHLERLDKPCITNLAEAMGLDRSTLGRNLRVLESEGLIRLGACSDQRNRVVLMTSEGRARLQQAREAWEVVQAELAERLGAEKRAALMALLEELETLD